MKMMDGAASRAIWNSWLTSFSLSPIHLDTCKNNQTNAGQPPLVSDIHERDALIRTRLESLSALEEEIGGMPNWPLLGMVSWGTGVVVSRQPSAFEQRSIAPETELSMKDSLARPCRVSFTIFTISEHSKTTSIAAV